MEILTKNVQLLERIEEKFKNMVPNKDVKLEIIITYVRRMFLYKS